MNRLPITDKTAPRVALVGFYLLLSCLGLLGNAPARAQWEYKLYGATSLAFSPDGRQLAAGSIEDWLSPGDLRVWNVKSGRLLHRVRYRYGVQDVAFSPDGKTLAVATAAEKSAPIRLWNVRSWRVERAFGDRQYIYSIAFSPDGKRLVAGSDMGENGETDDAYLWNIPKRRSRALPHSDGLAQMLFAPRGHFVVGGFYSGYNNDDSENLRGWNSTGKFLWQHPQPGLRDIAFMPDGRTFIAGVGELADDKKYTGGALQIWDAATGQRRQIMKRPESISAIAVSHDGKTWASGDRQGVVRLWNVRKRRVAKTLPLRKGVINALKFSPDGHFLAGIDGRRRVFLLPLR